MSDNNKWDELLSRWVELCAREGRDIPAKEVWPDGSPEEQAELDRRIRDQRFVAQLLHPLPQAGSNPTAPHVEGYELVECLGRGGFGEVWKARKQGDRHFHVALKLVDVRTGAGEVEMAALDLITELRHPHLVSTTGAWRHGDYLVIEMELANRTLWDVFRERTEGACQAIDGDELLGYFREAAEGIDYLNSRQHTLAGEAVAICHGDIKPQNLLLFGNHVKVADFGLVRALRHTLTGHSGGKSLPYAAPEFFRGQTHRRSDQYCLAVSYCMLRGGGLPFNVATNEAEGWRFVHLFCQPDLAMLPEPEREVVARALSKNREQRWPSCGEFVARLRADQLSPSAPIMASSALPKPSLYFTGRGEELEQLRQSFTDQNNDSRICIQVLSGQGGNGKTQIALKYAERYRNEYTAAFWVRADSPADITSGFVGIAQQLGLAQAQDAEQSLAVAAAQGWLERNSEWLLVLDNVEAPDDIKTFVPRNHQGHTLVTSRAQVFDAFAVKPISVLPFRIGEAVQFLLKRTDQERDALVESDAVEELARELGCLPLALEQAGAYILAKQARFYDYLITYRKLRLKLLEKMSPVAGNYEESVATTWRLNFTQVQKRSRASADLLRVSALLHPDEIPLELLERGGQHMGPAVAKALELWQDEPVVLDELLEPLTQYSLIRRDRIARTYSIHPLVQEVVKGSLLRNQMPRWAERVVRAMNAAFPNQELPHWPLCEKLLSHALCCARHIEECGLAFQESDKLLDRIGLYLSRRGHFSQSEALHRAALKISEAARGQDHRDSARNCVGLSLVLADQGRYPEAQLYCAHAVRIYEETGHDCLDLARALACLVAILRSQGRYAEAQSHCERAVTIFEAALGPTNVDLAVSLYNLSTLLRAQGCYTEAEVAGRRALDIQETTLGTDHPSVASSLNNLGNIFRAQGRYGEAERCYRKAVGIKETILGPDHPDLANSLGNLACLLRDQGRPAEGILLNKQVLGICEKSLPPSHPLLANCLVSLGICHEDLGQFAEAQHLYERAAAIYELAHGTEHPNVAMTLNNLGELLSKQGQYADAEQFIRRALGIVEKLLGAAHPDVASCLVNLGVVLRGQGRYDEAEPFYRRALSIYEMAHGAEHADVGITLNNLGNLLCSQGRKAEGLLLCERSVAIIEKSLGTEHPVLADSLDSLAAILCTLGRHDEAEPLYRHALSIYEKASAPELSDLISSLCRLADTLDTLGRYSEAEPLHRQVESIRQKTRDSELSRRP